jgi:hypothetical protein
VEDSNTSVYKSVNYISVLVGIIVMGAFIYDQHSVTVSVLAGVGFYGAVAGVLIITPHAKDIAIAHMKEVTIRQNNELPYEAQRSLENVQVVPYPRIADTQPVAPARVPEGQRFVPAQAEPDDSAKREAAAWLLQLFTQDGTPDPKKILLQSEKERPGRIRIAAPSRPAKQYLMDKSIIHDLGNGFRLNLTRCPTITAAQNLLV